MASVSLLRELLRAQGALRYYASWDHAVRARRMGLVARLRRCSTCRSVRRRNPDRPPRLRGTVRSAVAGWPASMRTSLLVGNPSVEWFVGRSTSHDDRRDDHDRNQKSVQRSGRQKVEKHPLDEGLPRH